jgi:hypothetical protein
MDHPKIRAIPDRMPSGIGIQYLAGYGLIISSQHILANRFTKFQPPRSTEKTIIPLNIAFIFSPYNKQVQWKNGTTRSFQNQFSGRFSTDLGRYV